MIVETKYLLRAGKTRMLTALIVLGLIVGTLPMAGLHAASVQVTPDVYTDGAGGQQGLDVYSTGGSNKPAIIFVHGGGWRVGDKNQYEGLGNQAAQRGYVAISINYRLGSAGAYYQYEDVMRALDAIRANAEKYGVDPSRMAILGDSAGGSLAMRVAASGQAGLAAAVGWSAPVNAYTAIFNSLQSFAIGLDHSTCVPTDPAALASLIPTDLGGTNTSSQGIDVNEGTMLNLLSGTAGQASNSGIAPGTVGIGSNAAPVNSSTVDISAVVNNLAGLAQQATGTTPTGDTNTTVAIGVENLVGLALGTAARVASTSSDPQAQRASSVIGQLAQTTGNNSTTDSIYDPKSPTATAAIKAAAAKSPLVATATHTADAPVGPEIQRAVLALFDVLGCQDNFRVLSPALNFAKNTPPTFLANAQSEFLVHPGQAIEYSNNLRNAGIDSEYLILPGANHMGYDDRAVEPTFAFLAKYLTP